MKNILIFNDISGLGNCSMSANLPVFAHLGHYCMPVVTACYSCQTGFSNFSATPNPNTVDFAKRVCTNATPNAFYVGFCNDFDTLKGVGQIVSDVLPKDCYLFVDPIMGDNGKLYPVFDNAYVEAMKQLVRLADCISPNLTEACLLANYNYDEIVSHKNVPDYLQYCGNVFSNFLKVTGCRKAVITGIRCAPNLICNVVLEDGRTDYVTNVRTDVDFSGTGDVFSSVLLGDILNGNGLRNATVKAANFVASAAQLTERSDRRFGVDFCKILNTL